MAWNTWLFVPEGKTWQKISPHPKTSECDNFGPNQYFFIFFFSFFKLDQDLSRNQPQKFIKESVEAYWLTDHCMNRRWHSIPFCNMHLKKLQFKYHNTVTRCVQFESVRGSVYNDLILSVYRLKSSFLLEIFYNVFLLAQIRDCKVCQYNFNFPMLNPHRQLCK